jgi:GDP-L-fucose synthase
MMATSNRLAPAIPADSKIYVAGHLGLVGSALMRNLASRGYGGIIARTKSELNLTDKSAVDRFFGEYKPEFVFLAAARVGGIMANDTYPAEFIQQNLAIEANVIDAAWHHGVKRLLCLGSSCIYPRDCPQPISENYFMTGPLERTNRPYAIAKIAGIEMCSAYNRQYGTRFLATMPTNLYGPNDNYDLETSHVVPALIHRFHDAKLRGAASVTAWGTGAPRREFMHVDDMADASVFLLGLRDAEFDRLARLDAPLINIGTGKDLTIRELTELVRETVGFTGSIGWDTSKPNGTPRKQLDVSRLASFGWRHTIDLREGLVRTYADFQRTLDSPLPPENLR